MDSNPSHDCKNVPQSPSQFTGGFLKTRGLVSEQTSLGAWILCCILVLLLMAVLLLYHFFLVSGGQSFSPFLTVFVLLIPFFPYCALNRADRV